MDNREVYNICYSCCRKCFKLLIKSISSIISHNEYVNIYLFNNNIRYYTNRGTILSETDEMEFGSYHIKYIKELLHGGKHKLYVVDVSKWMDIFVGCKPMKHQINNYTRILMPIIMRKYTDKYLYLDEDTLCVGSLSKLFSIAFKGDVCGFTNEPILRDRYDRIYTDKYINDGLLLMKSNIDVNTKMINLCKCYTYFGKFISRDQFILNYSSDMIPLPINYVRDCDKMLYYKLMMELIYTECKEYNICHLHMFKYIIE